MTDPTSSTVPLSERELSEIERLADAATPGPWTAMSRNGDTEPRDHDFLGWEIHRETWEDGPPQPQRGQFERAADALFIAAMNPVVALCLVAMARRVGHLEHENRELRKVVFDRANQPIQHPRLIVEDTDDE